MRSAVNLLKNGPKISDPIKRHDTQLKLFDINRKLGEKCHHADFSSVWDPLTGWLPTGVLKHGLSGIQVTTFFGLNKFKNISAMKLMFICKTLKFYVNFKDAINLAENVFCFEDNCGWTCCGSFSQLRQECMW